MTNKKQEENIVTPKIAKLIDSLSKRPLEEIDSKENLDRLFDHMFRESTKRWFENIKSK